MKGIMRLEVVRADGVIDVIENENMVTNIFNKMMYDLFYSADSNVYSPSATLHYDTKNKVLTIPRFSMYASSGVTRDTTQANPPTVLAMTEGLKGSTLCGDSYIVSIQSNEGSGGLTITAEFSKIEGNVSSIGLCIPSDNNHNASKSRGLYNKPLGYVINHADYVPYYTDGAGMDVYTNTVKVGGRPKFLNILHEYNFGANKLLGVKAYRVDNDDLVQEYDLSGLGVVVPRNTSIKRLPLVPTSDGTYALLLQCDYVNNSGTLDYAYMQVELDSNLVPTGRVGKLLYMNDTHLQSSLNDTVDIVSQVVYAEPLSIGGKVYSIAYDTRNKKLKGYINIVGALNPTVEPSNPTTTVDIKVSGENDIFKLFNGVYNGSSYYALGGTKVDIKGVIESGVLPPLEGVDELSNKIELEGGYVFGVSNPNGGYADVRCAMLKESVNVPLNKPKMVIGRPASLLTCCATGGVTVGKNDILRVQYTLLM